MKKFTSLVLIAVMIFAFAGCKKEEKKPTPQGLAPELAVMNENKEISVFAQELVWGGKVFDYEKNVLEQIKEEKSPSSLKAGNNITLEFKEKSPMLITFRAHLLKVADVDVSDKAISELVVADFVSGKATYTIKDTFGEYIKENMKDSVGKKVKVGYVLNCTFEENNTCDYAFVIEL